MVAGVLSQRVAASVLGKLLGISERRVREMRDQGVIPSVDGQYVVGEAIPAYCSHIRPSSGRASAGGADSAQNLDQARIEVLNEQRDRLRMLNDQMRGETVLAGDVLTVAGAFVDAMRAACLGYPTQMAPLVLGMKTLAEVRDKLTEGMHEVTTRVSATEIVSAVHDHARRRAGRSASGDAVVPPDGAAAETHGEPVG